MTLQPGDTIKTGDYSGTEITFFEGSTVEMEASTEIAVAELGISATGSTKIRLTQLLGKTVSRVKKLTDSGSSFNIETPAAIAAVRGSTMTVTVAANGRTVVGNEHGDIRIIVSGTEYTISEGMQRTIAPGEPPSAEVPINPPGGGFPAPQARLEVTVQAAPPEAHVGDVITYTCSLHNTGDLSFHSISATSNVSGNATYQSGDTNADGMLDPNETWILTSIYSVQAGDYPHVVASVTISATASTGVTVVDTETVTTPILPKVIITSPAEGATVHNRTVEVTGTVSDTSITAGNITINEVSSPIVISEGSFTTSGNLTDGENTITATVSNGQEQTASDTITVYLVPYAIRIELTWNTDNNTDLDAHLIRPGSIFNDPAGGDCYYGNPNPDWGIPGTPGDNPFLDRDDFAGYGPEIITLLQPYDQGVYQYKVHYYPEGQAGAPTMATVRIWFYEVLVEKYTKEMVFDEVWDCVNINWASGILSIVIPQ
jgi:uncharacterized repeat protein (TIGR01451 family)